MKSRVAARAAFLSGATVVSLLLALLATYAYGGLFAHSRYYDGTLKRVNVKDAELIAGLLDSAGAQAGFPRDAAKFKETFKPLYGLMLFELHFGGSEVLSTLHPERKPGEVLKRVSLGNKTPVDPADDHVLVIRRYEPPSWDREFWRWLLKPRNWSGTSLDRITGSFVAFFILSFLGCLAFGWRARATHLEHEVLPHLRTGGRE